MKTFGYIMLGLVIILVLSLVGFGMKSCSIAQNHAYKSMENAVISYDEYQDIYNTCIQLNNDLGVIKDTPLDDLQFTQFSKTQRVNAIKQNLNRWIAEYNAKSKHIDKKWWKSTELPYQLSKTDFSNY
jgi:hypothetical protein